MKHIWLGAVSTAVLLSGCAPVVYDRQPAPVVSLNTGQRPHVQQGQPVGSVHTTTAPVSRPVQHQPTPPPTPVRPRQPQSSNNNIQVAAASPYGKPAVAEPYKSDNDDGWNVSANSKPNSSKPAQAPDKPTRSEESNVRQAASEPVRPKERETTQSNTQDDDTAQETQVASVAPVNKPAKNDNDRSSPVSTLLKKASASLGKGDLDGAAAYLENAHRIEPKNAKILYDIANIRYHQGRYKDAENFAGRATNAGGSNAMMKKAWALIANARKSLGDNQGAIVAAEKAASL